jgi:signal peptidase
MKTAKKVVSIVVDVLIVIIFIVSLLVIIANVAREKDEEPNLFGYTFSAVQSDSMTPTFKKGDMVIGKMPTKDTEIKVGDIISFYQIENNLRIINTHRVIEVQDVGGSKIYYTMGDKVRKEVHGDKPVNKDSYGADAVAKTDDQIVAVYQSKLVGFGSFTDFLRKPLGFILIVALPIVLIIVWQIYKLIALYMESKKAQILESAHSNEPTEEQKNAIIEEYLKSLGNNGASNGGSENNTEQSEE